MTFTTSGYGYNPTLFSGYTSAMPPLLGNSSLTGYGSAGSLYGSSLFGGYQPQMYQTGNPFTSGLYNFPGQQQGYNNMSGLMSMMMGLMTSMLQMMGQLFQQTTGQQTGTNQGDKTQTNIPTNINFKDNKSIQKGMKQLVGNGPAGKLFASLQKADPDSTQAQKLMAQITKHMEKEGKSDTQIKAFSLLNALAQQNTVITSLKKTLKNLDKNSTEYKGVLARLSALNTSTGTLVNDYQALA
jgi:hypothetical protein